MKIICTLFIMAVFLVNVVAGLRQAYRLYAKRFQRCQGVIRVSMVRDADATDWREYKVHRSLMTYWPRVEYDYLVSGRTFRGDQISFAKVGSSRISDIKKTLARYPVGALVTVFHNQDDPAEAYLIHPGKHVYTSLAFVAGFTLVSAFLLFMVWSFVD